MQKRSTHVVLAAILLIFGYYTWEHFSPKKTEANKKLVKVSDKKKRLLDHQPQDGMDKAMAYEFELTKDPALNIVPRERLLAAENFRKQKLASMAESYYNSSFGN